MLSDHNLIMGVISQFFFRLTQIVKYGEILSTYEDIFRDYGSLHSVYESSAALGTEASVKIDDAAAVGIRARSNESTVLQEFEKTGKSINAKPPKGELNDVTSSASAVAVTSVPAAADENPATYMTPLHEAVRDGNNDKVLELLEEGADPCI
ncbi:unnamed protein product [Sphagnum balticum]